MKLTHENGSILVIPVSEFEADLLTQLFNNKTITTTYDNDRKYITITPETINQSTPKDPLQQFISENILDS